MERERFGSFCEPLLPVLRGVAVLLMILCVKTACTGTGASAALRGAAGPLAVLSLRRRSAAANLLRWDLGKSCGFVSRETTSLAGERCFGTCAVAGTASGAARVMEASGFLSAT